MRGDFSRVTFNPALGYSLVLMQQGRVLVDADWNEQAAIHLHFLRQLAADLIGPHGGPADRLGFGVKIAPGNRPDLQLSSGRYYVDGLPCELAARYRDGVEVPLHASEQPFPPFEAEAFDLPDDPYLVYLDVWEQHVTPLERPALADVALGGADTCTRARLVWQVRTLFLPDTNLDVSGFRSCAALTPERLRQVRELLTRPGRRGQLRVRARQPEAQTEPCLTAPDNRYRGPENQLYRVEVHRGGPLAQATFKWSRENGSVVYAVNPSASSGKVMEVTGLRDSERGFTAGDWVELAWPGLAWQGLSGELMQVAQVRGQRLTLNVAPSGGRPETGEGGPLFVSRWDQQEREGAPLRDGAVPIQESLDDNGWIELEDGVQIQFQAGDHQYRAGDHWIFPARTATGDVDWPQDPQGAPLARPPLGVDHHYAPLALVEGNTVMDLRRAFGGLAQCLP